MCMSLFSDSIIVKHFMNRTNENQQSLSFLVGPCGHYCNGQELHYLCRDSLNCRIGGHRDQEVGCKSREKQQENKSKQPH